MSLGQLVQQLRQIAQEGAAGLDLPAEAGPSSTALQPPELLKTPSGLDASPPAPGPAAALGAKKAGGVGVALLVAVVVAALLGGVLLYLFLNRKSGTPRQARPEESSPSEGSAPPVPEGLRRRIEAYAQRVAGMEQDQQQEEEDIRQAGDEARERASSAGRQVRFSESVTEYPIPARRVSRRAEQDQSQHSQQQGTVAAPEPAELHDEHEIPTLRIKPAQIL